MRRPEGTPPPHCTASSRHWPGRDCMVRALRRVPPAARCLPCRGLRAPADSGGAAAALTGRTPLGSSPALSHTFAHLQRAPSERCATAAARRSRGRPQADCPLPPRPGHLPLMPARRPRPRTAPSRPARSRAPHRALRAAPPTSRSPRPLRERPAAPPGAGGGRASANSGPGSDEGVVNANQAA